MKFEVLSRKVMEDYIPTEDCVIISITDPNSEDVNFLHLPLGLLSLEFFDLDKDTEVFPYSRFMFTEEHAKNILKFFEKYKDDVNLVIVHCEFGISRSSAVAGALSKIYNGEDQYFFDNYTPNMLVYRTILNSYYGDPYENEI